MESCNCCCMLFSSVLEGARQPSCLADLEWTLAWKNTFCLLFREPSRKDIQQGNKDVACFILNQMEPFTISESLVLLLAWLKICNKIPDKTLSWEVISNLSFLWRGTNSFHFRVSIDPVASWAVKINPTSSTSYSSSCSLYTSFLIPVFFFCISSSFHSNIICLFRLCEFHSIPFLWVHPQLPQQLHCSTYYVLYLCSFSHNIGVLEIQRNKNILQSYQAEHCTELQAL